jgi:hypothetical protein
MCGCLLLQFLAIDCWIETNYFVPFYGANIATLVLLVIAPIVYFSAPLFFRGCCPNLESSYSASVQNTAVKSVVFVMSVFYPAVAYLSLSLWNCQTVGQQSYLIADLTVTCDGPAYVMASAFNVFFVIVVVAGYPLGMFVVLRWLQQSNQLEDATYVARIGFLYSLPSSLFFM